MVNPAGFNSLGAYTGMPDVSDVLPSWFYPIQLIKLQQAITNFVITETEIIINFDGVIQPLSAEEIKLKPETQRAFEWLQIHCGIGDILNIGEKIKYSDKNYRVMMKKDYKLNGYIEYHCVEDYL